MTPREPTTVLFDTNFLLVPIRFGVDVFSELDRLLDGPHRVAVTTAVVDELQRLRGAARPSEAREFEFALSLSVKCTSLDEPLGIGEDVDDQLLRMAKRDGSLVATTDIQLRRRLRGAGVNVIYLRQRNHLDLDGLQPTSNNS